MIKFLGCLPRRLPLPYSEAFHAGFAAAGDTGDDTRACVAELRRMGATPHVVRCFRHQLLRPHPYLVLTKPLRLDIQCQRAASVKIGWKYLDD